MIKSAKGSNYKVTFAALVIGAVALALLQSMMLPVLPTIQRNVLGSGLPAESGRLATPISTMPSWPS